MPKHEDLTKVHVETSIPKAMFHIFKANVGGGVFLLATYFNLVGYLEGPVMLALAGFLTTDCISMLIKVKRRVRDFEGAQGPSGSAAEAEAAHVPLEAPSTFEDLSALLFTSHLRLWVNASLIITQYGFCIMYLQYSASLLVEIFSGGSYLLFVILGALVATPFTFLTNRLHLMAYGSIAATCYITLSVLVTTFDVFGVLTGSAGSETPAISRPGGVKAFGTIGGSATFLASSLSVLQCIGVILPVENSVVEKDKYLFATRVTMALIVLLYSVFGLSGYLAYGNELQSSIVHHLPPQYFSTACAQLALAVALWLTYPVQYLPAIQITEKLLIKYTEKKYEDGGAKPSHEELQASRFKKLVGLRLVLNAVIAVFAYSVGADTVAKVWSLMGSVASTSLCVTIPAVMYLRLSEGSDPVDASSSSSPSDENDPTMLLREKSSGMPLNNYLHPYKEIFDLRGALFSYARLRAVSYVVVGIVVSIIGSYSVLANW